MRARLPFRYKFVLSLFVGLAPAVAAFLYSGAAKRLEPVVAAKAVMFRKPVIDPIGTVVTVVDFVKDPAEESLRVLPPEFGHQAAVDVELSEEAMKAQEEDAAATRLELGLLPEGGLPDPSLSVFGAEWAQVQRTSEALPIPAGPHTAGLNFQSSAAGAYQTPAGVARTAGAATAGEAGSAASSSAVGIRQLGGGNAQLGSGTLAVGVVRDAAGFAARPSAGQAVAVSGGRGMALGVALQPSNPAAVVSIAAAAAASRSGNPAAGAAGASSTASSVEPTVVRTATDSASSPAASAAAAAVVEPGSRGLAVLTDLVRGQTPLPVLTARDIIDLATLHAAMPVPEPASFATLALGLAAAAGFARSARRRRQSL